MGVVELEKNQILGDSFQLLVGLAEIHVPRMWVEKHPETDSQVSACYLLLDGIPFFITREQHSHTSM